MTQKSLWATSPNRSISFARPVLTGAGFALVLISLFLYGAGAPNPEWGKLWMIQPLIIVPLAGATGGAFYYFMNVLSSRGALNKTVAIVLSLFVYIVGLWLGTVLGLNGTYWN
jgi:hypothetical protein